MKVDHSWRSHDQAKRIVQLDDFAILGGQLYAGGSFLTIGGVSYTGVARWDGAAWQPLGSSTSSRLYSLSAYQGELLAGGQYVYYSGTSMGYTGPFLGRWSQSGIPWIAVQPMPRPVACRSHAAQFSLTPASGYTGVSYRWRRAGVPLVDGPTGSGSVLAGAASATLTISSPSTADNGSYDCLVSNSCGSATSSAATLGVCAADADCSGTIDPADVSYFVNVWFASFTGGSLAGDFDRNGSVEPADVSAFVSAWLGALAGSC